MQIIQILGIIFALFALSRAVLRFKDKNITWKGLVFWSVIWIGIIIVAIIPSIFNKLSTFVGIGRPVDILIYVSIILLFYMVFRLLIKLETIEQNITKLVREISIHKKRK